MNLLCRRVLVVLAGGALVGLASQLLDSAPGEVIAQEPRVLVVLEEDEPQSTYPFLARTMSEQRLAELLFDRFFTTTAGGDLTSRVFDEGWTARPPNLSFAVQEELKFSNGSKVTFSDVSFTLNDVYRRSDVGHDVGGWYARVFGDAQQITPMHGSVRFLVSMPDDGAERYLQTTVLLSREALTEASGGRPRLEETKRKPVGTGPFHAADTIESFDDVTLARNPHRPVRVRSGEPVGGIRLLYDQDAARQKELMEGGRADIWVSPPPAVLPPFRNQSDRYGIRTYDLMQWWYFALDHEAGHLSHPAVREALDVAIPRGQLVEKFGGDSARLTSGPFLPGSAWEASDLGPTEENKERVAELMQSAGYAKEGGRWIKDGEGFTLRLGVQSDIADDFADVVYGFQDAWEGVGFRIRVQSIRPSDWRDKVERGSASTSWDIILGRWNLDREEGALDLFMKRSAQGRQVNLFDYKNSEVSKLVNDFYNETSGPVREALMQRLHRLLHDDRPYLFLWTLRVQSIYRRDKVTGFRPGSFYYFTQVDRLAWRDSGGQ